MKSVFVVQHLRILEGEAEDVKMIGIYTSRNAALAAVDRLKGQPGFRDHPRLVDPETEGSVAEGFYIAEYVLDSDQWHEGFATV